MGFVYGFQKDKVYGVEDVNNIVANFTTAGVNIFTNKDENNLNTLSQALTNAGVQLTPHYSCKVVFDEVSSQLKINPGIAFFEDGATITIDSSGFLLEPHRYVYFKKDLILDTGYPVSSDEPPESLDIPLAEYQEGKLTDKRVFAKSKIEGFGQRTYGDSGDKYFPKKNIPSTEGEWVHLLTFEDTDPNWKYVMIYDDDDNGKNFCGYGLLEGNKTCFCACISENSWFLGASNYFVVDSPSSIDEKIIKFEKLENGTINLYYKGKAFYLQLQVKFA